MIAKAIEGSITNNSLKEPMYHQGKYEWADTGGIISNYGPTVIKLLLKNISPATRIGVSNLKYEI